MDDQYEWDYWYPAPVTVPCIDENGLAARCVIDENYRRSVGGYTPGQVGESGLQTYNETILDTLDLSFVGDMWWQNEKVMYWDTHTSDQNDGEVGEWSMPSQQSEDADFGFA